MEANPEQSQALDSWRGMAANHFIGCACRAEQHKVDFERWSRRRWILLQLGAAFLTGLAALSILKGASQGETLWWTSLVIAVLAAAMGALNAIFKPREQAQAHKAGHDDFVRLMHDFGDFQEICQLINFSEARAMWERQRREHSAVQGRTPQPSKRTKRIVAAKRQECPDDSS